MKTKRLLSIFIAMVLCLSSFTAFASDEQTDEKSNEQLKVFYNDDIINFDVEPIIENGRTLVPMRAIFETMGSAVYYAEEGIKQIVSARRANDSLMLTIGENKMYFNNKEIELDVPAKINNGRTLVPLRAISEAFECEVIWNGDTNTIYIYAPSNAYVISTEKLSETITDDEGNVLIEAVAYYPVAENPNNNPCLAEVNIDYKMDADQFMEEARAVKEDALNLRKQMGEDFVPFVYELTYEQTYRSWGYLSFINHKYINVGGAHPSKIMQSRTYCTSMSIDLSVSDILIEDNLGTSLVKYTTNLFVEKLKEIAPESADVYTYDYIKECLAYVEFYLTKNSLVLYLNQGELAPYALGVISVEIPYNPEIFDVDMRNNYKEEYVFESEYDKGYEWKIIDYSKDKLAVAEENTDYPPEKIYSEYYPVGVNKVTVKGTKKGNASLIMAHVKKGEGIETANQIYLSSFYVDEDNMLTLIITDEAMYLIDGEKAQNVDAVYPLPVTIDIFELEDCTVPVSLEKGHVYVDDSGKAVMDVMLYYYDLYDMADIASLEVNDVIVRRDEQVSITEIERLESGLVRINGGEENGGFDLISEDNTVYYETGMNDTKNYYELGEITIPVSDKFEYIDESDLDAEPKHYTFKDFSAEDSEIEYDFNSYNTSIVIENGTVIKMNKSYTP